MNIYVENEKKLKLNKFLAAKRKKRRKPKWKDVDRRGVLSRKRSNITR